MEEKRIFGVIPSPDDTRDYTVYPPAMGKLPKSFHLPEVKIRSQGAVGSCVAHALASAQDMTGDAEHSTKAIYGNRAEGQYKGKGMIPREALKNLMSWGNVPEQMFIGNVEMPTAKAEFDAMKDKLSGEAEYHRIEGYARCYGADDIKAALVSGMPVALTVRWYGDSVVNEDGIMIWGCTEYEGNHELLITGYEGDYFVIQNSWGRTWGNKGKCLSHVSSVLSSSTFVEAWALDLGCRKENHINIIRRTLKRGMRGDDVQQMQSILVGIGYYLGKAGADGIFGRDTQSAVKAYQAARGLDADGIVGKLTWAKLDKEEA